MQQDPDGFTPMMEGGRLLAERYRLLEKIGEGGAAEVYRALDTRLDRTVAIKLLRPQFTHDEASRKRFSVEAKAAAGLSHPSVVDVYDFGEAPDRSMFIAMQYVQGHNLKDILQERGRLTSAETISIAVQACAALSAAHQNGMIHRDVKPQNILIDKAGNAHLTDFGIVKALSAPALTQSGMTFGTAAYMSPEQATGAPVGPPSDLYSLACVMYEALAGMPPFTGDNPAVVAYKQVWEQPRPLHDMVPEVPPSLEELVMRCLSKDPARRYPTAAALSAALEGLRLGSNQPTQAVALAQAASAGAGTWTPLDARPPAELSQAVPMPRQGGGSTAGPASVPVPRVQRQTTPQRAVPQTQSLPRGAQQVNVSTGRRGMGWLPLLLVVLVGLVGCGLAAWQGRNLLGVLGGGAGTPTPTLPVIVAAEFTRTPTVTLGGIEQGSPVAPTAAPIPTSTAQPPATDTPQLPPPATETKPPEAAPTDTPEPAPPADTPTPAPPAETIEPAPTLPQGVRRVIIDASQFSGGYRNSDGTYHGRSATWVYGQGTPYSSMSATFTADDAASEGAFLDITGVDSEDEAKTPIKIAINGATIYQGPDPLPNDTKAGPRGKGNWATYRFNINPGLLNAGLNQITITNLDPSDKTNYPLFFMLNQASITWGG